MLARWSGMDRQRRIGWLIIVISVGYALFFLKTRLFAEGPEITRKEWVYFVLTFVGIMLGTINVRMSEMRERNQKTLPLVNPNQSSKK
jgi:hypothetical protein